MKKISRRQFLRFGAAAAGGALMACARLANEPWSQALADALDTKAFLPIVENGYLAPASAPTASPTPQPTAVTPTVTPPSTGSIIADHTIVEQYQNIPQFYIDQIKKMWVDIPGESHSYAYRRGCELLEAQDSRFQVNVTESGTPEGYTDQHMRISRATRGDINPANADAWIYSYGEEDWYTSPQAIQHTKDHLTYCNTNNLEIAVMGFGWCWDMTWKNAPGLGIDPVFQVRWAGSSEGGPDGSKRWGLDAGDLALTENHVCMDTYLDATLQYMAHCAANSFPTKIFFTTGPVDNDYNKGESGYQRYIKHEYIRNYVAAASERVLLDYADILTWSDAGQQNTLTWTDYGGTLQTFPFIHDDNMLDLAGNYDPVVGHIGERGALRLAKALWWLLARLAGWSG